MTHTLNVSANQSARTFTITRNGLKYRTCQMTHQEFDECQDNTDSDWETFMRYGDYYKV